MSLASVKSAKELKKVARTGLMTHRVSLSHPNCRCSKIPHIDKMSLITSSEVVKSTTQTMLLKIMIALALLKNETRAVDRNTSPEQPLPNAENAILPIEKFTRYSLDPTAIKNGRPIKPRYLNLRWD